MATSGKQYGDVDAELAIYATTLQMTNADKLRFVATLIEAGHTALARTLLRIVEEDLKAKEGA
jgi:hypothetical protein